MAEDTISVVIRGDNRLGPALTMARRELHDLASTTSLVSRSLTSLGGDAGQVAGVFGVLTIELRTLGQALQTTNTVGVMPLITRLGILAATVIATVAAVRKLRELLDVERGETIPGMGRLAFLEQQRQALLGMRRAQEFIATPEFQHRLREQGVTLQALAEQYRRGRDAVERMAEAERRAAETARQAAEEAARKAAAMREAVLQLEADAIVDFNIWQREQWEQAARARTDLFLREARRLQEEMLRIERETADLIVLANQQAIARIEEELRERLEETRRILEEIARLERETADLIEEANRQAIERIMEEERERLEQAREMLREQARLAEAIRHEWEQVRDVLVGGLVDAILEGKRFVDVLQEILRELLRMALQKWFTLILNPIFGLARGGVVSAQEGVVTRRVVPALLHPNEVVLPLPPGLRPQDLAAAVQGGGREVNLQVVMVDDRRQIPPPPPEYVQAVVVADVARRGPVFRAIRATER